MKTIWSIATAAVMLIAVLRGDSKIFAQTDSPLPLDVRAVWDLEEAYHETTSTRERISINGLWRWQPAEDESDRPPNENWGYFKVPGCWPGITDYLQKDCQTVYVHHSWEGRNLAGIASAWYEREITIPLTWTDRRITIHAEYLNSYAVAYVDGTRVGEIRFPAGEADLTSFCRPGETHVLSLLVVAMPLQGVMLSYNDSNSAREVEGSVARRGLCGDVSLVSTPRTARLGDVKVNTSVRNGKIAFEASLLELTSDTSYTVHAEVSEKGRRVAEFTSGPFHTRDVNDGRLAFEEDWLPEKLWDVHTPENQYEVTVSLLDAGGIVLDASHPIQFGFREFWIDGRDFYLNGTRIFLCAVPLDNAQIGAAWSTYDAALESLTRLQSFGINAVYTHNYGCEPGSHLSFEEILRAADDVGMLVSFSQPHFSHYDWDEDDAAEANGYANHAEFYVREAQNHPSVVMYSMSHNATGYSEDMNPDMIDGVHAPRSEWSQRNVDLALQAESIVKALDPTRVIYHHSSGNLGSMHTSNFYPNWVPIQEMSDWFEHWSTEGVKPFFTCEYGAPFMWDWAMYRGWYEGERNFGSAAAEWDFCLAEWNAQFLGDQAFKISEEEKRNLRWEAEQFREGKTWHRWDYPHVLGSSDFDERYPILAAYLNDNWRAFRTWGVSAVSPWEHRVFWKLRPSMERLAPVELASDWENLQRPGFSPDYIHDRYERMDLAYETSDWIATSAADAMYRNNRPLLAYIAGGPEHFTSKDHIFLPGETVEKQLVVINNSRETVTAACEWTLGLPTPLSDDQEFVVATGEQKRIALQFTLPDDIDPGDYSLNASVRFDTDEIQDDRFEISVLPIPDANDVSDANIALYDPKGDTNALLTSMGVRFDSIQAEADLSEYDLLIIGKAALTPEGPAPDIASVRDGLKVIVFEQTSEALEQRLGFRVQEYGLRNVFSRVPDHPYLDGLDEEYLRDWRGEATILPPTLDYETSDKYNGVPAVRWCGLEVPRLWRCGNRGNVASVLIEKPSVGDFLPIIDGGFSLQYSPLLEYREGSGMVLFCQMDVTGRTEEDPAAVQLVRNILSYVGRTFYPLRPEREALYVGDSIGQRYIDADAAIHGAAGVKGRSTSKVRVGVKNFEHAGLNLAPYEGGELSPEQVLIVGRGGANVLAENRSSVAQWLNDGGRMLTLQLDAEELNAFLPVPIQTTDQEHIAAFFEPFSIDSPFAGVGPADVHNRAPRELPLISGGAEIVANGVLAITNDSQVVLCQLAPFSFLDPSASDEGLVEVDQENLRKTFRRSSFLVTRLLGNMGVRSRTPLLSNFSTPPSGTAQETVIKNGDFRSPGDDNGMPDQWEFDASQTRARCELEGDGSDSCLRITCPESAVGDTGNVMLTQYDVPVEEEQWYLISLKARSEGLGDQSIDLALQDTTTWRPLFDYQRFTPSETWEEFTFLVQASGTAVSNTRFQIWYDQPGTVRISDIRMTPCNPPSQGRWTTGLYLDEPREWDDPYRFFRW